MKLLLLHGQGIISSRAKLQSIKKQFDINNVVVFGPESSAQEIIGSLVTPLLFSEERLIILENPSEDINLDSSLVTLDSSLVFWFDCELGLKNPFLEFIKKGKGEVLFFDVSKEVSAFPLLDCLANKDRKAYLEVQKLKLSGFDIFYILTMVFYLLRSLAVTPKNAPDFVKNKLDKQRKNFAPQKIADLYQKILQIEFKLKTGILNYAQAEFLLVDLFMD